MISGFARAGALPFVIDTDLGSDAATILGSLDALVLTGGTDVSARFGGAKWNPQCCDEGRDEVELGLIDQARARDLPILGICRGAQLLNVAYGGSLVADLASTTGAEIDHSPGEESIQRHAHKVDVQAGSQLAQMLGTEGLIDVNSQHHQAVESLGSGLVVSARATDGTIEAFEHTHESVVAVQWHPEVITEQDPLARRLLRAFVQSCETRLV